MTNLKTIDLLDEIDVKETELTIDVQDIEIKDKLTSDSGKHILKQINTNIKKIEETRKYIVGPYNKLVKQINTKAKDKSSGLDNLKKLIKTKLLNYQLKLDEEKKVLEDSLKEAIKESEQTDEIKEIIESEKAIINNEHKNESSKGVYYNYEIVSVDMKTIDEKYLEVKEGKIRTDLRKGIEIKGVTYNKVKEIR